LVDACIIAVVLNVCPKNTIRTPIAEMYECDLNEGIKNRVARYSTSAVPFATWYVKPFSSKNESTLHFSRFQPAVTANSPQ
jgi:hypothetical protein